MFYYILLDIFNIYIFNNSVVDTTFAKKRKIRYLSVTVYLFKQLIRRHQTEKQKNVIRLSVTVYLL